MLNPSNPSLGRALLCFAVFLFGLGVFLGGVQQRWRDAAMWGAVGVFLACYGLITLDALPRFQRALLIVGLAAGVLAFGIALYASVIGG